MLLAFETVGRTASACMVEAGGSVLAHRDLGGAEAEHGLVSLLDGLIRDHGHPSSLAVAAGPGSFTGLRIGITAARTLAWLEGVPVAGIDSLAARAAEAGDGLWWVLLPLKRDTTFHALFRVAGSLIEVLAPTVAAADAASQDLHPATTGATAIGPALTAKPGLAQRWCPGVAEGSPAALSARGVARVAAGVPAGPWDRLLPQYHQEPAPVLQRLAGRPS
jgi:tRNA threonylcarbamoyladenosine biosynthesis protein TsaB